MTNGWTGGQYSFVRIALAPMLGVPFLAFGFLGVWHTVGTPRLGEVVLPAALCVVGFGASIALALGWYDKAAALVMLAVWHFVIRVRTPGWLDPLPVAEALLLFHLTTPRAPYLSWAARGRADPDGGWRLTALHAWTPRVLLAVGLAAAFLVPEAGAPWPLLFLVPLAFDPGWIPPRGAGTEWIFYDGTCGVCHRGIRCALAEDRRGGLRFAPLAGPTFDTEVPEAERAALPDSIVVKTPAGALLTRSDGMLHIASALGGYWRLAAALERLLPRRLRNWMYDRMAASRTRWFGTTDGWCPVVSEPLRVRFHP